MATFTVRLNSPLAPEQAWGRVWDLDAHSRVIPLTRLRGDGTGGGGAAALGPGSTFVARTSVGPVGVDDVMEVRTFETPQDHAGQGRAVIHKRGRLVRGSIDAHIRPEAGGSVLTWTQTIGLMGVPAPADPIVRIVAAVAYRSVLTKLLAGS